MGKVLVTGGLGYIGSHTVVELLQHNYEVIVIDNLSNSRIEIVDRIHKITQAKFDYFIYELTDYNLVKSLFQQHKIDAVIHFAASILVEESVLNPIKYYNNNIISLLNLLTLNQEFKVKSFIFSSSCTVYGNAQAIPINEEAPVLPALSPYGYTKQVGEKILQDVCTANPQLNGISLRYFNPAGAHQSNLIGEYPLGNATRLIPLVTETAAGLRHKLLVFGNDYNTPDGTCVRDFIHVVDLAQAHVKAMEYAKKMESNYDVFNIGNGKGYSVMEVIKKFEACTGTPIRFEVTARRPGDAEKIYADVNKSKNILGWHTKKTLEDILDSAWKWQLYLNKEK